jgi:hypothetical protein
MNSWVRLGLVVILGVFLLRFAFGVLAGAMTLVKVLFPLALVAGAGLVLYGLVRGAGRRSLGNGHRGYLDD